MIARLSCVIFLVACVNAATWMGHLPLKPKELAHKEGCYVREINDVVPFGETVTPLGVCYRIECSRHMMYYASCGVVSTDDPKCYVTDEDVSKPYPHCCPDMKCDIDNSIL